MIAASLPDPGPVFTAQPSRPPRGRHVVVAIARDAAIAYAHIHLGDGVGGQVAWTGYAAHRSVRTASGTCS